MGLTVLTAQCAWAIEEPAYHYDKRVGKCVNRGGMPGFNHKHQGECGDLWGSDLKAAALSNSNLSGANLPRSVLSGADLTGADLSGANLIMAKLGDAKLQGAIFNERTILPFDRKEALRRGMVFVPMKEAKKVASSR